MKRIFMTGASGCIGHYLAEALIQDTDYELFFLVRNPDKIKFDYNARPYITIIEGDLSDIEFDADLLKTMDIAILAATSWGGAAESFDINVVKNLALMKLLDPQRCEQIIYFSTASILDNNNQPLPQAGQLGTDYIRTKYDCFTQLSKLEIAPKITTVFPTLVFGGDENKPYSHLSGGLADVVKWVGLLRWFQADGSFHYIHAQDIAQVVKYLVDNPPPEVEIKPGKSLPLERLFVIGNEPLTANQAIGEICRYFGKKIYFQIPVSLGLANILIAVFRIQMAAWDRFCLNYRHFTHKKYVNPASFGLTPYCRNLADLFRVSGLKSKS